MDYFRLEKNDSSILSEVIAGLTTFLTMSYVLTVNPAILKETGMPHGGAFVATALAASLCTLLMAFYANTPFAIAPGMGLNSFFIYTASIGMGFHWRETLAIVFAAGVIHITIMGTRLRKAIIHCIPDNLRYAVSVAIGLFIAYLGIKNAGLLTFTIEKGAYRISEKGTVLANSSTYPAMVEHFTSSHMVAFIGFVTTIFLLALEKKTGDRYGAFLIGIIGATFVGIPLGVTNMNEMRTFDFSTIVEIREVAFAFFGSPGILSLTAHPERLVLAILMCLGLSLTDILDSIASIGGIGSLPEKPIFTDDDLAVFQYPGNTSKLDRTLVANCFGGVISSLLGTSTSTTYIESVTGIASGGRTGLTSLVIGILFLLCLPLVGFFRIIPGEAVAPALVLSGLYLMSLVPRIRWHDLQESIPSGITILFMALSFSIISGVTAGFLSHIVMQTAYGKFRKLPVLFIVITTGLVLITMLHHILALFGGPVPS